MEIAELSDLLVWAAATALAVAMIAFAVDLGRRTDERVGARATAEARATVRAGSSDTRALGAEATVEALITAGLKELAV